MRRLLSWRGLALVLLSAILVLASCARATPTPPPVATPKPPKEVRMGIIAPLTGPAAAWGIALERGFLAWIEEFNAEGGIQAGGDTYLIKPYSYDDLGFLPAEGLKMLTKAALEDGVDYIITTSTEAVNFAEGPFATENKVLVLVWGAGGQRAQWPYLLGGVTGHPHYVVPAMSYVAQNYPEVKRVAVLAPDAPYGEDLRMWSEIAAQGEGLDVVFSELYPLDITDWNPLMTRLLATNPDLIWPVPVPGPSFADLLATGKTQGYTGMWYSVSWEVPVLTAKVPADYLEGGIGSMPEFSDPAQVGEQAYAIYQRVEAKWPGGFIGGLVDYSWGPLWAWEAGVKAANSVDPTAVKDALLALPEVNIPFLGNSKWGGEEMFGANLWLMTPGFVSQVVNGKNALVAKVSMYDWYQQHKDVALARLEKEKKLYWQD